jgi:hypothetical protein
MEYKSRIYTLDKSLGEPLSPICGSIIHSVIVSNVKHCGGVPTKHVITIVPYPEEDISEHVKGAENEPKWKFQITTHV